MKTTSTGTVNSYACTVSTCTKLFTYVKGLLLILALGLFSFNGLAQVNPQQTYSTELSQDIVPSADMPDPGAYHLNSRSQIIASKVNNPNLQADIACSDLDVVFILDESYSIRSEGAINDVRSGAFNLAQALEGSGANLRIIEFST